MMPDHKTAMEYSTNARHERHDAYKPNVPNEEEDHYILSLLTDVAHHKRMTALRAQWFPTHMLKVDAHVTLFQALPGSKLLEVKKDIAAVAARTAKFQILATNDGVYEMRKGVGINISDSGKESGQKKAAG
ncbi:hypothetical protein FZEAL_10748, partial [Fusarium zealandicum]